MIVPLGYDMTDGKKGSDTDIFRIIKQQAEKWGIHNGIQF